MNKGKLVANLKKAIGEHKWEAMSGFAAVAAITSISTLSNGWGWHGKGW